MSENKKTLVSRIHEKAEMVDRPFSMMLELTNACNHRCLFCSHRKMKRSIKMMELPFAKRMVDEAYDMGVRELALFMMGESFLYQDIDEIILYAKQKGYEYVYITSNGALAEPERMKKAIDAGVDRAAGWQVEVCLEEVCLEEVCRKMECRMAAWVEVFSRLAGWKNR